jgi:hypothetical protein
LLLFVANVTAILVGSVVMSLYRVPAVATRPRSGDDAPPQPVPDRLATMLVLIAVPLTTSSVLLIRRRGREDGVPDPASLRDAIAAGGVDVRLAAATPRGG